MSELLFDAPWWLIAVIAAVGVIVFLNANRRLDLTGRKIGLGILGLGILLLLFRWFIDTPRKVALRETSQLVTSVEAGDWTTFRSLLAPDAKLRVLSSRPIYNSAEQVTTAAQAGAEGIHLRAVHLRSAVAEREGPLVSVTTDIFTEQDQAGAPMLSSSWQFKFRKTDQGWRVDEIRALKIGDLPTEEIEQQLPKAH